VIESPVLYEASLSQYSSPLPLGEGGSRSETGEGASEVQEGRKAQKEEKERPSPPTPLPRGEGSKKRVRSKATIPGPEISIDFAASKITMQDKKYVFSPLSTVAQELIVSGGVEAMVKQRL